MTTSGEKKKFENREEKREKPINLDFQGMYATWEKISSTIMNEYVERWKPRISTWQPKTSKKRCESREREMLKEWRDREAGRVVIGS